MSQNPSQFQALQKGLRELGKRLLFLLGALIVFRIGSFIPIPGVDAKVLTRILDQQKGTIIDMFNMFSGGALSRASILALGIVPYISASIIIQLLSVIHPTLAEIKKEGSSGTRKLNSYTRYTTLILALMQSTGIAVGLPNLPFLKGLVLHQDIFFYATAVMSLTTGTMFLMWLGDQITAKGIGNGTSVLIFAGIVAELPPSIARAFEQARQGDISFFLLAVMAVLGFAVICFVVTMEKAQRRISFHHANRQYGRKLYLPSQSHLPLKINMSGVLPAVMASSIILFPTTLASWLGKGINSSWLSSIVFYLQPGQPIYILLYASAIIFFCFFYTSLVFNPKDTADNLKKSGAFIPGIRPGEKTAKYIDKIMTRLTCVGAAYITFICMMPEGLRSLFKIPFYFGGTSLLIVVVVVMDIMAQMQTALMSSQYESVLRKANLKGHNR